MSGVPSMVVARARTVEAPGWDVAGLSDGRLPSGALELVRQQQGDAGVALGATEFAPYVRITRRIDLGLDWNEGTWQLAT